MSSDASGAFPDGFLWGAATAAYQVEGAAALEGRGPCIWDTFTRQPGAIVRGDTGDVACDQYHRLEDDLDLLQRMGVRGYRASISWSRVLPNGRGPINQAGLDYYDRLVDGCLARGIQPMLTLYHWDLPQALQDEGGWANRATAEAFAEFARIAGAQLGDRVPYWITLNEPWCAAFVGHLMGLHAPGQRDEAAAFRAAHHLLLAHALAVPAIRSATTGAVGIALNLVSEQPASERADDQAAARRLDGTENRLFLDPIFKGAYPQDVLEYHGRHFEFNWIKPGDVTAMAAPLDFLGVNYYERHITRFDPDEPYHEASFTYPGSERTAVNIGVNPEGFVDVLTRAARESNGLPIYVTENGVAANDYVDPNGEINDIERQRFFELHFQAAREAIAKGVNLKGYFVWSFLDNFEWQMGYSKRYGVVYVDYRTQERIVKRSGRWYQGVIERNAL